MPWADHIDRMAAEEAQKAGQKGKERTFCSYWARTVGVGDVTAGNRCPCLIRTRRRAGDVTTDDLVDLIGSTSLMRRNCVQLGLALAVVLQSTLGGYSTHKGSDLLL